MACDLPLPRQVFLADPFPVLHATRFTLYAAIMIGSLAGTVRDMNTEGVLLEVGGVGYRVAVLPPLLAESKVGKSLSVLTHLHVREDELALYGFTTKEELAFFRMLLAVPGVGPKSAMSILAIAPIEVLVRAISAGDASLLMKVSGVGRKTAERIVVELKTRLEREHPSLVAQGATPHADIIEALVALGYTASEARAAVRRLPRDVASVEEGVRAALQAIGQQAEQR